MRKTAFALTIIVPLVFSDISSGTIWIGTSSITGQVVRPDGYNQSIAQYRLSRQSFDDYTANAMLDNQDLGGYYLFTNQTSYSLRVDAGSSAGVEPASPFHSLYVEQGDGPTSLKCNMLLEPVKSLGFVLGGLESDAWLHVYDENGDSVKNYIIPSPLSSGLRRWIAVMEEDCYISKVELTPVSAESYAIDDLELGYTPEPGSLVMFIGMAWMFGGRLRRRI